MSRISLLSLLASVGLIAGCGEPQQDASLRPQAVGAPTATAAAAAAVPPASVDFGPPQGLPIVAPLTHAPNVPPPITRRYPAKVVVNLEVQEKEGELAPGVKYTFWTFGGQVPGEFIRIRQGDTVEFHLKNAADSKMPHNIDLHAVSGPGGGAESTFTAPGHESVFTFKALNNGLFVYHCATAPVGMHIANGMYGLILVEPPEGLPPVDREFYVMQGDFYTSGKTGEKGVQSFDLDKALDEKPTYVLFNGQEGALTGTHALQAKVGERIRLFVGNGGPNLVSSFHVIGEIFDHAYTEGGSLAQQNVQTTLIPSGGAAMVDFKVDVPGTYSMVDHSIFRAFNKGAVGQLKVEGPANEAVYSKEEPTAQATPGRLENAPLMVADPHANAPANAAPNAAANAAGSPLEAQMKDGQRVFNSICAACHQPGGTGLPGAIPPLAGSDFLMKDKQRSIHIVTEGLSGPITVSGQNYNGQMPPLGYLSDDEVANVLTFVRNSFGNKGAPVTKQEVTKVRSGGASVAGGK